MNKDWSAMNKEMQALLSKETTYRDAISKVIALRAVLFGQITDIVTNYPEDAFWQMPFSGAEGYHSKTLGYSIWHIFRIEDIVAHEMIAGDQQVLFAQGFSETVRSPIITTGNELAGDAIAEFSKQLDIRELYRYAREVICSLKRTVRFTVWRSCRLPAQSGVFDRTCFLTNESHHNMAPEKALFAL